MHDSLVPIRKLIWCAVEHWCVIHGVQFAYRYNNILSQMCNQVQK